MIARITPGIVCIVLIASGCTGLKHTESAASKNTSSTRPAVVNKNPKFLDNISVTPESSHTTRSDGNKPSRNNSHEQNYYPYSSEIEKASALQIKYALLLNTEVEEIRNPVLFKFIDDWYGTRYCLGGTTRNCIDCSAFVQTFFASVYGVNIPRTAKEQYEAADKIANSKLQQGDLLFFDTRGGVSHVGIYLQNNKFVHASTSGGVMISDMFEVYYAKRYIGAGRIDNVNATAGTR